MAQRYVKRPNGNSLPYAVYWMHTQASATTEAQTCYRIVSIDPAPRNLSFRLEERYKSGHIETRRLESHDFLQGKPSQKDKSKAAAELDNAIQSRLYPAIVSFLNSRDIDYSTCHCIMVERQLPENYIATRIAQHLLSYFMLVTCDKGVYPTIMEIDPRFKSKMLGAPANLNKTGLKAWAKEAASFLLNCRQDHDGMRLYGAIRKQDDPADTIVQSEAVARLFEWPTTVVPDTGTKQPVSPWSYEPTTIRLKLPPSSDEGQLAEKPKLRLIVSQTPI